MDAAAARRLLEVDAAASEAELRAAYRQALHRTHPDRHAGGSDAVRAVVEAYRSLLTAVPAAAAAPPAAATAPVPTPAAVTVEGDTVAADLPAGDLFALLVEAGHGLGEVAYLDRQAGLLEVVVDLAGYGACSLVLTLQGRSSGLTEAFCTVEPLGAGPSPPVESIAELLASALRPLAAS